MPYTYPSIDLRKAMYSWLLLKQQTGQFTRSDFQIRETWQPSNTIESEVLTDGTLWIAAVAHDETVLTRGKAYQADPQLFIFLQRRVDNPQDVDELDSWVRLMDEVLYHAKLLEYANYAWIRTECYKDDSNPETGLSPVGIRQNLVEVLRIVTFRVGLE